MAHARALSETPRSDLASPPVGIECRGVTAGYFRTKVLEEISFAVHEPAIYIVLGQNGAGKTTLFRTLAGILKPWTGTVEVDGLPNHLLEARNRLQFLSHIDGMPGGLRVQEALAFYARVERIPPEGVERVLTLLDLQELRGKYWAELSQGQKKRVAVARIFLREKSIYLLDEPTTNLDPKIASEIRDLILGLSKDKIVLYSSHNLFEAHEIGRYVLVLKRGRLAHFGRIDDLRPSRYIVGVRASRVEHVFDSSAREGDYYLQELAGPEEVPRFIRELVAKGVQIREVKEMHNPLEDLFE